MAQQPYYGWMYAFGSDNGDCEFHKPVDSLQGRVCTTVRVGSYHSHFKSLGISFLPSTRRSGHGACQHDTDDISY